MTTVIYLGSIICGCWLSTNLYLHGQWEVAGVFSKLTWDVGSELKRLYWH